MLDLTPSLPFFQNNSVQKQSGRGTTPSMHSGFPGRAWCPHDQGKWWWPRERGRWPTWGRPEAESPSVILTSCSVMDKILCLSLSFSVHKMSDWPESVILTLYLVAPGNHGGHQREDQADVQPPTPLPPQRNSSAFCSVIQMDLNKGSCSAEVPFAKKGRT